jgi:type III pantothenate kinase
MLLLIDVGNSQTVIATVEPAVGSFHHRWSVETKRDLAAPGWQALISGCAAESKFDFTAVSAIAISSVVPSITPTLSTLFHEWLSVQPLIVASNLTVGIQLGVHQPEKVGTDRLCNATAAYQRVGNSVIVIDVGTATKIDAITRDGIFVGGAIAPGIGISLEALVGRAAQLYTVPLDFPQSPIGTSTVEAMQSGLVLGHLTMMEGMIVRFREYLGDEATAILTGGYGQLFTQNSTAFDNFDPDLTLRGILRIWQLNQK